MSEFHSAASHQSIALHGASLLSAFEQYCRIKRLPFNADLFLQQFPPPYTTDTLMHAARAFHFRIVAVSVNLQAFDQLPCPFMALHQVVDNQAHQLCVVLEVNQRELSLMLSGDEVPRQMDQQTFQYHYAGQVFLLSPEVQMPADPDQARAASFGFRWFLPELFRHRYIWRDVLLASLALQLLALATPLFTQVIIDKVIVHRSISTLIVMAVGLGVLTLFSALLGWARQTLLLHTGNRIDAVLGMSVFRHLFSLPVAYFSNRPTGVIASRLHGVEILREFIASAALSLLLDLPFLLIFIALMFWYSVQLTLITLSVLFVIVLLSLLLTPVFRAQLNQQFLLGARNQAFLTEYVSGIETVKSLQLEPQLNERYSGYLAAYLQASFKTRQLANLYNTAANTLDQLMRLLILMVGAYMAMNSTEFTIGMLVAFQMFAASLSAPAMRLVSLWQQFQQADLSLKRLGDVMDAPAEPQTIQPSRMTQRRGHIRIAGLSFRHSERHPWLYKNFYLTLEPGKSYALMGPSGSGKSTLARLLLGFHVPDDGRILIDGVDIRHLSVNELRAYFGVVPQETVLFSGTLLENLQIASPQASFEQIVGACLMAGIHDGIEQLPDGYQTIVGERGVGLSGGQRQRLAIARALLRQAYILIFDEASSALDKQTAEYFAQTVNSLRGKITMLFIAHALPANLQVDQVIHLSEISTDQVAHA